MSLEGASFIQETPIRPRMLKKPSVRSALDLFSGGAIRTSDMDRPL